MPEFHVYFTTEASAPRIVVEAEDEIDAIDKAYESDDLPSLGSICYQCARRFDMGGDWEPSAVTDADGNTVWEERSR